jgi:uncharacterized protein YndB with AHSA1/START domain
MEKDTTIIQCRRTFRHPVQKVFGYFLDPVMVKQWFGPKEFSIGQINLEPKAGGHLEIEMITPKNEVLWVKGTYTEIVANEKIAYTFMYEPDGPNLGQTLVTIHFRNMSDRETDVQLIHTIYKTINPEGRAKGWEAGFDKLETLLQNDNS